MYFRNIICKSKGLIITPPSPLHPVTGFALRLRRRTSRQQLCPFVQWPAMFPLHVPLQDWRRHCFLQSSNIYYFNFSRVSSIRIVTFCLTLTVHCENTVYRIIMITIITVRLDSPFKVSVWEHYCNY